MNDGPILLRARPITVEAFQVQANNLAYVAAWCGGIIRHGEGLWLVTDMGQPATANIGDWIIKAPNGGFYPAPDAALFAKYESVV